MTFRVSISRQEDYLATVGYDSKLHDQAYSEDNDNVESSLELQQGSSQASENHILDQSVTNVNNEEEKDYAYRYF